MGRSERGNGCVGRTRQKRPRAGRDVGRQVDHDVVTRDSPANRDGVSAHFADPSVRKSIEVDLALIDQYDTLIVGVGPAFFDACQRWKRRRH